jgi:zinc/manganese transport system substrate-binding protein
MSRSGPAVTPRPRAPRRAGLAAAAVCATLLLAACSTSSPTTSAAAGASTAGKPINVVATINAWGSIAAQLGGSRVRQTSLITNPATDPHAYEPTPTDARVVAGADVFIENGCEPVATRPPSIPRAEMRKRFRYLCDRLDSASRRSSQNSTDK